MCLCVFRVKHLTHRSASSNLHMSGHLAQIASSKQVAGKQVPSLQSLSFSYFHSSTLPHFVIVVVGHSNHTSIEQIAIYKYILHFGCDPLLLFATLHFHTINIESSSFQSPVQTVGTEPIQYNINTNKRSHGKCCRKFRQRNQRKNNKKLIIIIIK